MTTPLAVESAEIVRKRRFAVKTTQDVMNILEHMKITRTQGVLRFEVDVRCGGTPTSVYVEERAKFEPIDRLP